MRLNVNKRYYTKNHNQDKKIKIKKNFLTFTFPFPFSSLYFIFISLWTILNQHKWIKKALGFSAVACNTGPWLSAKGTAQIDLLFDRNDRVITLCEMKFSGNEFSITQDYDAQLRNKTERFISETSCRKSVQLALITTYGLERNKYAGRFQSVVTLDALFDKL